MCSPRPLTLRGMFCLRPRESYFGGKHLLIMPRKIPHLRCHKTMEFDALSFFFSFSFLVGTFVRGMTPGEANLGLIHGLAYFK